MEVVVSPLTFGPGGSKRRFGSSPIHATSNPATGSTEDFDMDDCTPGGENGYGFQSTKRRRRGSGEGLGTESSSFSFKAKENWSQSPFAMAPCRSPIVAAVAQSPMKRSRGGAFAHHDDSPLSQKLHELQVMVEQQAIEIQRLKSEKESLAQQQLLASTTSSSSEVSNHHVAKVEHENKILKRAVTIQQERQIQLSAELEGARQFKVYAEERIRRLEQLNLTLQYRLQAVNMSPVNDNMWSSPRPPDIY